jgi:DNA invertase Pin-like site-specific DNA recombinase
VGVRRAKPVITSASTPICSAMVQLCKRIVKGLEPQLAVVADRLPQTAVCERTELSAAPYLIGYARVSKGDDQSNAAQLRALKVAGCNRMFEEAASGGRWDRPKLQEMIGQLRDGDVVVVWKLDRSSRSLKDLLHLMEKIEAAGAGFRSLTEAIDTTTPAGRMMMQMVGSFAEFERAMIRERTSAGLAQARLEGRLGGRRRKLGDRKRRKLRSPLSRAANRARKWRGSTT